MIVLNVWNLSTNKGNGSEDSLTLYTNWPHVIVQLPYALSSVAQLCPTLCDPMNRSTPGLPVHGKGKLLEGKN